MLPLFLALLLSGPVPTPVPPPQMQRCTVRCLDDVTEYTWTGTICWYREQLSCPRTQWICQESERVICRNVVERLGAWNPEYLPQRRY